MNPALTPEEAVRVAREAIILAICERTTAALRTNDGDKVVLTDVFDAYRDALLTAERARLAARVTALRFDLRGADDGDGHFDEWEEMHPQGRYLDADAVLALLREVK